MKFRALNSSRALSLFSAIVLVVLCGPGAAWAQRARLGARDSGAPARRPAAPIQRHVNEPGDHFCRIIKFNIADDDEDGVLGYLFAKPQERNARVLRLQVRDDPELEIVLNGRKFTPVEYSDVLLKGLYCTIGWEWEPVEERRKPTTKLLRSIRFDTIEVEGTFVGSDDESITLRARPVEGTQWPHLDARRRMSGNANATPVSQPSLTVHALVFDDASDMVNAENLPTGVWALEPGQKIRARIVFSRNEGILTHLQVLTEGVAAETPREKRVAEPRRPRIRLGPG